MNVVFSLLLLISVRGEAEVSFNLCESSDCRIVGGSPTTITNYPFTVSISIGNYRHACGGSIISRNKVITAAHCYRSSYFNSYKIHAGSTNGASSGSIHRVVWTVLHPRFRTTSRGTAIHDVALMFVYPSFRFNRRIQAINLVLPSQKLVAGTKVTALGWGNTEEGGKLSKVLREVAVPIVDLQNCREMYSLNRSFIRSGMICAGYREGGKDSCQGDSGGPLIFGKTLVGITSWGSGCARPNRPGVYVDVSYYRNWLDKY